MDIEDAYGYESEMMEATRAAGFWALASLGRRLRRASLIASLAFYLDLDPVVDGRRAFLLHLSLFARPLLHSL